MDALTNRRTFLQAVAGAAVGLVSPPTVAENAEAVRRLWFLDGTMLGNPTEAVAAALTGPRFRYRAVDGEFSPWLPMSARGELSESVRLLAGVQYELQYAGLFDNARPMTTQYYSWPAMPGTNMRLCTVAV